MQTTETYVQIWKYEGPFHSIVDGLGDLQTRNKEGAINDS